MMKQTLQRVRMGATMWVAVGAMVMAAHAGGTATHASTAKASAHTAIKGNPGDDPLLLKMIKTAMRSAVMVELIAKNYLYAGNDIATTKAKDAMRKEFKQFEADQKTLANALSDPKSKNLMTFIQMNVDDLKDLTQRPYGLDHAQEVVDLGEAISEGERKLAANFRKKLSRDYPVGKEFRYDIAQIGKYYMAYQAGIKDDNTVRQMKKEVGEFDEKIHELTTYPKNTVEMSQAINRMDKLWDIVKQFYLDIKEGGLPIIVYQTTNKLDKEVVSYSNMMLKTIKN